MKIAAWAVFSLAAFVLAFIVFGVLQTVVKGISQ